MKQLIQRVRLLLRPRRVPQFPFHPLWELEADETLPPNSLDEAYNNGPTISIAELEDEV